MESSPRHGPRMVRQLLRQEVAESIKRYILDNRLRPGDPLPTETELCAALGASRSSVREAVKVLDALDIVEVRHGHGTYVGRLSLSALVESLTFRGLLSPGDDVRVLADLVDVRELFERGMAAHIIAALDPQKLASLDDAVRLMRECPAGAGKGFVEADRAFHALLVAPLGNELIGQLSLAFWDVYTVVSAELHTLARIDGSATAAAHQSIVDAARSGDVEDFARAVTEHYAPVRRRMAEARSRPTAAGPRGA